VPNTFRDILEGKTSLGQKTGPEAHPSPKLRSLMCTLRKEHNICCATHVLQTETHLHFEVVLGVLRPDQQALHQAREIRQEVLRGETGNHHLRKKTTVRS
jgi:hypothetical protein